MRIVCITAEAMYACVHGMEFAMMSFDARIRKIPQMASAYKTVENKKTNNPARAAARLINICSSRDGASQSKFSGILLLHNLVNALTTQVKKIRNLAERAALAAHRQNFFVSVDVGRRPWSKRTPLPSSKRFKFLDAGRREKALLPSLAHVTNPGTEIDFLALNDFDVNRWDADMPLSGGELAKSRGVQFEAGAVVHARRLHQCNLISREGS